MSMYEKKNKKTTTKNFKTMKQNPPPDPTYTHRYIVANNLPAFLACLNVDIAVTDHKQLESRKS